MKTVLKIVQIGAIILAVGVLAYMTYGFGSGAYGVNIHNCSLAVLICTSIYWLTYFALKRRNKPARED